MHVSCVGLGLSVVENCSDAEWVWRGGGLRPCAVARPHSQTPISERPFIHPTWQRANVIHCSHNQIAVLFARGDAFAPLQMAPAAACKAARSGVACTHAASTTALHPVAAAVGKYTVFTSFLAAKSITARWSGSCTVGSTETKAYMLKGASEMQRCKPRRSILRRSLACARVRLVRLNFHARVGGVVDGGGLAHCER